MKRLITVGGPGTSRKVVEAVQALGAKPSIHINVLWFFGSAAIARTWALLLAVRLLSQAPSRSVPCQGLVLGNPLNVIPLYPLILGSNRRIVVVDDGLSMLQFAKSRARPNVRAFSWADRLGLAGPPGLLEQRITAYTLFSDVVFPDGVEVLENVSFCRWRDQIQVERGVAWILGNPLVEEGGLDLATYRLVISRVYRSLLRSGLDTFYLPHRREQRGVTRELLRRLGPKLVRTVTPVEERVMDEGRVASVVIAFGSTALETLSQMTKPTCKLWNVLLVSPSAKTGADSPQAIFSRHQAHGRIGTITVEELDHHTFL